MSSREKSPVGENTRTACRTLNHVPRARTRDHAAGGCFDLCSGVCVCVCVCVCECVRACETCARRVKRLGPGRNPNPRCRLKTSSGDSYRCLLLQRIPARTSEHVGFVRGLRGEQLML